MKGILLACCIGLLVSVANGAESSKSVKAAAKKKAAIQTLVDQFYFNKSTQGVEALVAKSNRAISSFEVCEEKPDIGSCITAACAKLPSHYCDDKSDLQEISKMCQNNVDGSCITAACAKLPASYCDDKDDIAEIAKGCAGQNGSCLKAACDHLPSHYCDDKSDIKDITTMCSGLVDGSCIEAVCAQLPSHYCDDKGDLQEIISSCKGQ